MKRYMLLISFLTLILLGGCTYDITTNSELPYDTETPVVEVHENNVAEYNDSPIIIPLTINPNTNTGEDQENEPNETEQNTNTEQNIEEDKDTNIPELPPQDQQTGSDKWGW